MLLRLAWTTGLCCIGLGVALGCSEDDAGFGSATGTAGAAATGGGGDGGTTTGVGGTATGVGGTTTGTGATGGDGGQGGTASGSGTGGHVGGAGGGCAPPATPAGPNPSHQAAGIDSTTVTAIDWADAAGATGYDVYFGAACPPPAYPHLAFQYVTSSERTGLSLDSETDYCWQVVALNAEAGCVAQGPVWTFQTACVDPLPGAPLVTSTSVNYPAGTTADAYTLTFDEDVANVGTSLSWTPIVGTGSLDSITAVDGRTYDLAMSGLADGDSYTLTVGTGVSDDCGSSLSAPVDITFAVLTTGQSCADAIDVTHATFPVQLSGTFDDDPTVGTSCEALPANAVWFTYTAPATGYFDIHAANDTATLAYSRLAVFETPSCSPYGTEIACHTNADQVIDAKVLLTAGTTYLLLFHTDSDLYTMVDPAITIQPGSPPPPGSSCLLPATLSSPNHYVGTSNEDCWSWNVDITDSQNDNDFETCDPVVGADVVIEFTTGPSQTVLNYDALVANTENDEGYVAVEVLAADCAAGSSVHCFSLGAGSPPSHTEAVAVSPSTTYYVWVADGFASHYRPFVNVCLW